MKKANYLKLLAALLVSAALPQQLLSGPVVDAHGVRGAIHDDEAADGAKATAVDVHVVRAVTASAGAADGSAGKRAEGLVGMASDVRPSDAAAATVSKPSITITPGNVTQGYGGGEAYKTGGITITGPKGNGVAYTYSITIKPPSENEYHDFQVSAVGSKADVHVNGGNTTYLNSKTVIKYVGAPVLERKIQNAQARRRGTLSSYVTALAAGNAVLVPASFPLFATGTTVFTVQAGSANAMVFTSDSTGFFGIGAAPLSRNATANKAVQRLYPNASAAQRSSFATKLASGGVATMTVTVSSTGRTKDYRMSVSLVTANAQTYVVVNGPPVGTPSVGTAQACNALVFNAFN